ncbi:BsuPI-related putative proteinase inhibitor [Halalkalibacter oceani]|uniref:BsuPI-related putative proteinase inhibitor n=1 Tax=Halalkalibacter oceani TaxID=1653776 RepID=UPI003394B220
MKTWLIMLLLVLTACGLGEHRAIEESETADEKRGEEAMPANWLMELQTNQAGETIQVELQVVNEDESDHTLAFSSGQRYELILRDAHGNEVYRFSDDRVFMMAITYEEFSPNEKKTFREQINTAELPTGTYTLEAELLVAAVDNEPLPEGEVFRQEVKVEVE